MTTKYLTGVYSGGYVLNPIYTNLFIESSARVRGTGVTANSAASIWNYGTVNAIAPGSNGVSLNAGGALTNGSATDTVALVKGGYGVFAQNALAMIANFGTIQGIAGSGVRMDAGGTVTNGFSADTKALISGNVGVFAQNGLATIANFGTIEGTAGPAVFLGAGGIVTNGSAADTTALMEGVGRGLTAGSASATITNYGTIQALISGEGVYLGAGGTVTNGSAADTAALIAGNTYGVIAVDALATITNFGTITGSGSTDPGIGLRAGGTVTNGSAADTTALIVGNSYGVFLEASGVIANFGTIRNTGNYGASVRLYGSGTVTNGSEIDTTALIEGRRGVYCQIALATIINFGTIQGLSRYGVDLTAGGTMTNGSAGDATALIEGSVGVWTSGVATVTNFGTITGTGGTALQFNSARDVLVVGAGCAFNGAVLGDGGHLNLASGIGAISDLSGGNVTVSGSMPTTTFTNFATLRIEAGAQYTLTGTGAIAAGGTTTLFDSGVFTVTGALAVAGTVSGAGTLALAGGTLAVNAGAAITVANWSLTSGTATVNSSLTYKGVFKESAGAALTLSTGHILTVTGAATLSGTVNGASTLKVSNATASGLTIGGTATFEDAGAIKQTGAVTVGDAITNAATLAIDAGATWTITNNSSLALGTSTLSTITNGGTLIKSGGTGVSVIAVKVADAGSMVAAVGTLDFTKALTGAGSMSVMSGATLEANSNVASTLSLTFNGGGAVLALKAPSAFKATIHGFAPTDSIDLLGKTATSATLNGSDQLVINNGTITIATLQLAGAYTGSTFNVASDGHGGTNITVTTGAAVAPPVAARRPVLLFAAAMAGLGAGAGVGHVTGGAHLDAWRPVLSTSRTQIV